MSAKHFLIVYYDLQDFQADQELRKKLSHLLIGKEYVIQEIPEKLASLSLFSDQAILQGTINKLIETFADSSVDIVYLHHTDTPMTTSPRFIPSRPAHLMSFGVVLNKQTIWDFFFFTRFFFVFNLRKLLSGSQSFSRLETNGNIITFYLQHQSHDLSPEAGFFESHFKHKGLKYLKTVI